MYSNVFSKASLIVLFFISQISGCLPQDQAGESAAGLSLSAGLFTEINPESIGLSADQLPQGAHLYSVDTGVLQELLSKAASDDATVSDGQAFIPQADGTLTAVSFFESPVMEAELASRYSELKTYRFSTEATPSINGRMLVINNAVIDLTALTADGFFRVDKLLVNEEIYYVAALEENRSELSAPIPLSDDVQGNGDPAIPLDPNNVFSAGDTLRIFKLAASTTGEYYQARDEGNGINDVMASIVAEVNNANTIFETEISSRLVLINETDNVFFADAETDPFTEGHTACQLRDENEAAIQDVIDQANYDIGFAFGVGNGNGCASNVLCEVDKERGSALIAIANPAGSATGLLAHEMGHQFGALHSWSGINGSCSAAEYNDGSGYEPGSGTTIMSYNGLCDSDNVDTGNVGAGRYFHTNSFDEIMDNVINGSGSTCGTTQETGNSVPVVEAGANYTIPRGTPFVLTGSAVDADADPLVYNWEQHDVAAGQRNIDTDDGLGPIIRSVPPTSEPSRTIPNMDDLLSNTQRKGEILAVTDRSLNFRLTARDNRIGGGGVAYDEMTVTTNGEPFFVTSPKGAEIIGAGCPIPVTWTVGGSGDVADNVDILLSGDNGLTFDSLLAATANNGSAEAATCQVSTQSRVIVQAVDNIFFDVSDAPFTVQNVDPVVSVSAEGGEVDAMCEFKVDYSSIVTDDCGVDAVDISVNVTPLSDNFILGTVSINAVNDSATQVSADGSFTVSDLTSSPAILKIEVVGLDNCSNEASSSVEISIVDNTPPTIDVTASPDILWSPNHKMNEINTTVIAEDNCPVVSYVITSVSSDEPDNGIADGNTDNDIQYVDVGTDDTSFSLRAERAGNGDGRTYTVEYKATDGSGNEASNTDTVEVPHNK